jgi:hypothetical protein
MRGATSAARAAAAMLTAAATVAALRVPAAADQRPMPDGAATALPSATTPAAPGPPAPASASPPAAEAPVPGATPRTRNLCPLPSDAYLRARLAGAVERDLEWHAGAMECEGMQRPDGLGLRVTFRGRLGDEPVTFVFGVPRLAEGAAGRAVPVNVTLIREGHGVYGTRGEDKCTLDEVRQTPLSPDPKGRRWRVEARGFCLEPARAVGGRPDDAILLSTFDFAGYLTWELDPGPAAPASTAPLAVSR